MRLLIAGICGFVGSTLARVFLEAQTPDGAPVEVIGVDNLSRNGSELNRLTLRRRGARIWHGDLRCPEDLRPLPAVDWVIDAAANPSVLAGVDGRVSSRRVFDDNLSSTLNLLEYCKQYHAGFVLLSTSRVYSLPALAALPVVVNGSALALDETGVLPAGVSAAGISEAFSTAAPVSLYGASKLASEVLALEYGHAFKFPVWINRCGVLAGAGQFGRQDQGIFSYWLNSYLRRRPLRYLGFGGHGWQSRDVLHPRDLVPLLRKQFAWAGELPERIFNLGGGRENTLSLRQLSDWCERRFGRHSVAECADARPFDIPWMVMDARRASEAWDWQPQTRVVDILEEIAAHALEHDDWLEISGTA